MVERVVATPAAVELIERLRARHGDLLFHQSGGCCDGSAPMCYPAGEFRTGPGDVKLGRIAGCDVFMGAAQFAYWSHTQLIIDVVPGRGAGFSLDAAHPNVLAPGKRPYHTIIPGFLTQNGVPVGPFGVMGGHMQPQGHVQMMVNMLDYGLNPQASLDAPRWSWWGERYAKLEAHADPAIAAGLLACGHALEVDTDSAPFGCGQIIWRMPNGVYVAGSDGRTDGCAIGY